jgi:hypothetical protein
VGVKPSLCHGALLIVGGLSYPTTHKYKAINIVDRFLGLSFRVSYNGQNNIPVTGLGW